MANFGTISGLDKRIIGQLEEDGRLSFTALSDKVGISKTPCWSRVKSLEDNSVILGYSARLDPTKLGLALRAMVRVVVNFHEHEAFEAAVLAHPNIYQCHSTTGDFDYVLDVLASDVGALDHLLKRDLSQLPGVQRFNSSISTRMVKAPGGYSRMLLADS